MVVQRILVYHIPSIICPTHLYPFIHLYGLLMPPEATAEIAVTGNIRISYLVRKLLFKAHAILTICCFVRLLSVVVVYNVDVVIAQGLGI